MTELPVNQIVQGDCLEVMAGWPEKSVDLVFGSPPYEDCRTYGIDFDLTGEDWVAWMVEVVRESLRICRGLVAYVVEGKTRDFAYSATPILLMADLKRAGITLRKPPIYHRIGIPGTGGPDWFRNDYEFCVCCTNGGKLPWSDNTACGHPPKWAPGGEMSHRLTDGTRRNQWGGSPGAAETTPKNGGFHSSKPRPSHHIQTKTMARADGSMEMQRYVPPVLANPGNVITCKVGGGLMGSPLAHKNEAPFAETLAERFVLSFCPPGGIVLDPFSGSGTTAAVAKKYGRNYIGIDVRLSQVELGAIRLRNTEAPLFAPEGHQ